MRSRVFVTGMGAVSSLGLGRAALWSSIVSGRTGASPVSSFDTTRIGRAIAAEVKIFDPRDHLSEVEARHAGRCSAFAIAAARMAVTDASLTNTALESDRAAVVLGTTMGEADVVAALDAQWMHDGAEAISPRALPKYGPYLLSMAVARALRTRGRVLTLPAACAAGNYAIGFAADIIRAGQADVVISGASEMLQEVQFAGFARLGAIAPERCQPFDLNRQGLTLGEGAGVLVLESEAHAIARGAPLLAEVGGYGLGCDGHHITRPDPTGARIVHAMKEAIARSGISPSEVDFINAHGTGTRANDAVESLAVATVFEGRRVPISSVKSMLGHTMGASSALEAITCVETLLTGIYPPTISFETPDPECDVDLVANTARSGRADVVLNNALAFGGYDAVVLFAKPGRLPERQEARS